MKKLLFSILMVLVFATNSFAVATLYKVAHSGAWATANEWATTAAHAYPGDASDYPKAGDTVIIDSNFAGYTVTLGVNAACAVLDMTGNTTGVLALGNYALSTTGNITLAGNGSNLTAGTGYLSATGTITITCNGVYIPYLVLNGSTTFTLGSDLLVTGILQIAGLTTTISGAHDIACGTLKLVNSVNNFTLVAGRTMTVTTGLILSGSGFAASSIASSTGSATNIVYNGAASAAKVAGLTFTNVTVTGTGAPIYNWFGSGTNTGITNVTNASIGGGSGYSTGF